METIVTRFAPSPTGHLHIGGARTALFNWLFARQNKGSFILRIEDTDRERSKQEYTDSILDSMNWLGLDWDQGPFYQSQRMDIYRDHVKKLLDDGKAYWCHCSAEDLETKRQAAMQSGLKPKYDGTCREMGLGPAQGAVVRLRAPLVGATAYHDLIKGPISFDNRELDDLILLRSDGTPTYHMAVVVDDVTMNVTHVIRGDDHVNNTPRQILIFQALDYPLPRFGHVPMILGADKTRLSKRHGATSVLAYREMGYLPQALNNYLVRLGWSFGDEEVFSLQDLLEKFSLESVGKSAGVFNPEKLDWLNALWIKDSPAEEIADRLKPFMGSRSVETDDMGKLTGAIKTLQPRCKTLAEMADASLFYFREPELNPDAAKKFLRPVAEQPLLELAKQLQALDQWNEKAMEPVFQGLMDDLDIKLGKIAQPLRVALTGTSVSPGIFEIMDVLGKDETLKRLQKGLEYIAKRKLESGEQQ